MRTDSRARDMTTFRAEFPMVLTCARMAAGMTSRARRPEIRHSAG